MNIRYLTLAIFVTVTLASLVGLAWTLGALPKSGRSHSVRLADAAGLVEGNAVRIAGVQVGHIKKISVDGNEAVLDLKIHPEVTLFDEACASPQMKGLLGEKFLQVRQPRAGRALEAGAPIVCIDPSVDIGEALNSMSGVVDSQDSLYGPITRIIKRFDGLTEAMDQQGLPRERLDALLGDVEEMARTTKAMLAENREDLRAIVKGTRELVENPKLKRMIDNGDAVLAELRREVPGLVADGKRLFADGERALDKVEKLIDAVDAGKVKKIFDGIDAMVIDGQKILTSVSKVTVPLMRDLATIARKAAAINEKMIRDMIEVRGMKVRFGPVPKSVKDEINAMPDE